VPVGLEPSTDVPFKNVLLVYGGFPEVDVKATPVPDA